MKIKKVHSILFTNQCELNCRYCNLRSKPEWGTNKDYTKSELFAEIEAHQDADEFLFTGGEPFIYWKWIKEIINKYGNKFSYSFNTSGYNCTEEQLQFLSQYNCSFQLSVDGPRKIALYQRPNADDHSYDYWDRVEPLFSVFLYYFPQTPWKSIISRRLIPFVPEIYKAAASYGFKRVQFELDFEEQPWRGSSKAAWTEQDFKDYSLAWDIILLQIIDTLKDGGYPTLDARLESLLIQLLKTSLKPFSIESLNCGISGGRDISTVYKREPGQCLSSIARQENTTIEKIFKRIEAEQALGCPRDKDCKLFDYCCRFSCIKDNHTATDSFMNPPDEWCYSTKMFGNLALKILAIGNEFLYDNTNYQEWLMDLKRRRTC